MIRGEAPLPALAVVATVGAAPAQAKAVPPLHEVLDLRLLPPFAETEAEPVALPSVVVDASRVVALPVQTLAQAETVAQRVLRTLASLVQVVEVRVFVFDFGSFRCLFGGVIGQEEKRGALSQAKAVHGCRWASLLALLELCWGGVFSAAVLGSQHEEQQQAGDRARPHEP